MLCKADVEDFCINTMTEHDRVFAAWVILVVLTHWETLTGQVNTGNTFYLVEIKYLCNTTHLMAVFTRSYCLQP